MASPASRSLLPPRPTPASPTQHQPPPPKQVHPASLAIFNVVNAWSIMFLGLIARDPRGRDLPQAQNLWLGQVFLTNVFFIPYLALRAGPQPQPPKVRLSTMRAFSDCLSFRSLAGCPALLLRCPPATS